MKIGVFTWFYKRERQPKQSDIMAAEYARGYLAGFIEALWSARCRKLNHPARKFPKRRSYSNGNHRKEQWWRLYAGTGRLWPGVCVDVVDLGMVQPRTPPIDRSTGFNCAGFSTLNRPGNGQAAHGRSQLWLSLEREIPLAPSFGGLAREKFTEEELEGFDVERLIGVNCQVHILHNKYQGKTTGSCRRSSLQPEAWRRWKFPRTTFAKKSAIGCGPGAETRTATITKKRKLPTSVPMRTSLFN